jgi:hypothetical protein
MDSANAAVASARWHMKCPLCNKAEGAISFKEHSKSQPGGPGLAMSTEIICENCGSLGRMNYGFDFACPSGITEIEHGKAAAILFSMHLKDNPPDAIQQLGAIANRSVESGHDDGDAGTPCFNCGSTRKRPTSD